MLCASRFLLAVLCIARIKVVSFNAVFVESLETTLKFSDTSQKFLDINS